MGNSQWVVRSWRISTVSRSECLNRKEFRTRVIPGNGLNPVYNEDPFMFRKVNRL